MAILAEVMVLLSVGSVLMSANSGPKRSIGSLILRGIMFNPIVVAIVLGAALAGTGLALPEAITRFLGFLGGAAGPAALFALGGALAMQRLDRRAAVAACLITVAKVAAYPLLVWLILGSHDAARCVLGECCRSDCEPAVGREYLSSRPAV
jgi:malonate transporter and related proteins